MTSRNNSHNDFFLCPSHVLTPHICELRSAPPSVRVWAELLSVRISMCGAFEFRPDSCGDRALLYSIPMLG